MKFRRLMPILLCLFLIYLQFTSPLKAKEQCDGFGIETAQSQNPAGVKITNITLGCAAHNLGLHEGDVIVSVNDNLPDAEGLSNLLAHIIPTFAYTLKVIEEDGSQQIISNPKPHAIVDDPIEINDPAAALQRLDESEDFVNNQEEAELLPTQASQEQMKGEKPIYAQVKEMGYDGLKWVKWLVFFVVLSFTLTPLLIIYGSNGRNVALYLGGAAILGAAHADRNTIKEAVESAKFAAMIYFILLFLGPIGTIYCIYRPIFALVSDSDKTYCCAMTWLGSTDIAKKSISPDGRWLAEIRETQNNYLGLGDKELQEKHALSVMDLETGYHVRWPQTGQELIGVNTDYNEVNKIKINDGLYIQPVDYLSRIETWYKLDFADDFIKPLNSDHIIQTPIHYALINVEPKYQQVALQDVATGDIVTIQSNMDFNANYLSYDGRVLALVKANAKDKPTDGLVRQLANLLGNYLLESWTIEFWDVALNKKIASYSGRGINSDAWNKNDGVLEFKGQTKFLESSQDGRLWYMIKSDGFIHVFDMNKHMV